MPPSDNYVADLVPGLEALTRAYCLDYQGERLHREEFVQKNLECRTKKNVLDHSLLLKRVERTLNEHFCEFWSECRKRCQYQDETIMFAEDIKVWKPFTSCSAARSPVKRRRKSVFLNQTEIKLYGKQEEDSHSEDSSNLSSPQEDCAMSLSNSPRVDLDLHSFIPIVDIGGLFSSDYESRLEVAMQIGNACRTAGFFYVVNHGVSSIVHENLVNHMKRFFALPPEQKDTVSMRRLNCYRGYFRLGEEDLNQEEYRDKDGRYNKYTNGDLKEGYDMGGNYEGESPFHVDTPFPGEDIAPGFKDALVDYYSNLADLGRSLTRGFALSLGISEEYFLPSFEKDPMCTLRLLHYPPRIGASDETADNEVQMGCGAHSDYGLATLLWQDMSGGLQVWNEAKGRYVDATPVEGSFVINCGDMLQLWTNRVYRSTVHRVLNKSENDRYSIPFFFNPSWNTTIECIDTEECKSNGSIQSKTTCGEVLMDRYNTAYKKKSTV